MIIYRVEVLINLGCLGKQMASIGYNYDDADIQYVIVDNAPLYLELEPTTLDAVTLLEINGAIADDRYERMVAAEEHKRDMQREDALFNREIIVG